MSNMFEEIVCRTRKLGYRDHSKEGDYKNADGLLVCGKCHTVKECIQEFPKGSGKMLKFPSECLCDKKEAEARKKLISQQKWNERIKHLYKQGITDKAYLKNTFEKDDNRNPELTELCKKYISHWQENKENCNGILFYGNTGGGKSFHACCIANQLINMGVPVLVSRISDLVNNRVDKNADKINLNSFELIVLDDIGTENSTQTAYNIIDDIYRAGIPLIVTTNLTPAELKKPDNMDKQRIYDRILERCCITQRVDVKISRLDMAKSRQREILNEWNT